MTLKFKEKYFNYVFKEIIKNFLRKQLMTESYDISNLKDYTFTIEIIKNKYTKYFTLNLIKIYKDGFMKECLFSKQYLRKKDITNVKDWINEINRLIVSTQNYK